MSCALDWPVALVISFIWGEEAANCAVIEGDVGDDFESLQRASREAQIEGDYEQAVALARRAYKAARSAEDRVIACIREAGGHGGLGRYSEALKISQRCLAETSVSGEIRRQLESNLAGDYYTLSAPPEAESLSFKLVNWYEANPPTSYRDRVTEAFSLYVYGAVGQMACQPRDCTDRARIAEQALGRSHSLYLRLFEEFGGQHHAGIAHTIVGALLHVEVILGRRSAIEAMHEIDAGLEAVIDPSQAMVGDTLESYGWWCIFGCEIAQRYLSDEELLQHYMAEFTDKADVIARRLGNWALRERVFAMEYENFERVERLTGWRALLTLDDEDLEALVGVVGRFPRFSTTGLKLFEAHSAATGL